MKLPKSFKSWFAALALVALLPADARAAFEQGAVDAWVIWDPFLAAVEKQSGALQGLEIWVVELSLKRYAFGVAPVTAAVGAEQQKFADTLHALKLIPKPIRVADALPAINAALAAQAK